MKTVFSNSQVAHVWAQQTQSSGRNSGNTLFFNDASIWSYGSHYQAARIHTVKGQKVALINSNGYSISTHKHLGYIRSALHGLMPYFHTSDVNDLRKASLELDDLAYKSIEVELKRVKVKNKDEIKSSFASIHYYFELANELRTIIGKGSIWPTKKQNDAVQKHLEKRLARYLELNTPEMRAKAKLATEKRNARKLELALEKEAEKVSKFRNGEQVGTLYNLPYELLRVQGEKVQTSRGAEVPLRDASLLYRAIKAGKDVLGSKVGNFTLVAVTDLGTDKAIKIGCHTVLLSEAERVLELKVA